MSVTVAELLDLPCLREAKVLAGNEGLQKTVSSVSVLEYAFADEVQHEIFNNLDFYGSELVLTAFANIRNDIDAQCDNIRMLAQAGEVGLILYYVGIIMPAVDTRLIELANALNFTLICMPEKRYNLRYSEVICEVMEAIIHDQMLDSSFQNEILERVSRLPVYKRSIDTILRMLSDRLRASLILSDTMGRVLNTVTWPRTLIIQDEIYALLKRCDTSAIKVSVNKDEIWLYKLGVNTPSGGVLTLFLMKQDEPLKNEDVRQVGEVLQLSLNLWNQEHGKDVLPELVRAILQDEPVKMRRIAEVFDVDVASIHNMWIVSPRQGSFAISQRNQQESEVLAVVQKELQHTCKVVVTDAFDESIVAFVDDANVADGLDAAAEAACEKLHKKQVDVILTVFYNLASTSDVRRAYLLARKSMATAQNIFFQKSIFSAEELRFADQCRKIIENGEDEVNAYMSILNNFEQEERLSFTEMCDTISVYLLDSNSHIGETAKRMHLHKNTIKYRIGKVSERLHYDVNRMPEAVALYTAVALRRIIAGK